MEYRPDKFVVIEIDSSHYGPVRKVLGSWFGGYAGADNWRVSSEIKEFFIKDDIYEFHNQSGSIYYCHKDTEGMHMYTKSIYERWLKEAEESKDTIGIRIVPMSEYFVGEIFDCY